MRIAEAMHLLIEDGLTEARLGLVREESRMDLRGLMDGYESCRGLEPSDVLDLIARAGLSAMKAREAGGGDKTYEAGYDRAVRFYASVLSCALSYHGLPTLIAVTFRARTKYAEIVGYADNKDDWEETNGQ